MTRRYTRSTYPTDELIRSLDDAALLAHMGVPRRHWEYALAGAGASMPPEIESWVSDIGSIYRPAAGGAPSLVGRGLVLHGDPGSGKTTMAAALLLRLVRMMIPNSDPTGRNWTWHGACMGAFVDWQSASALFRRAAGDEGDAAQEVSVLKTRMKPGGPVLTRGDFLVLDDISRERATSFNLNELHSILRERASEGFPTIITTNHDPDAWEEVHGPVMANFLGRQFGEVAF